MERGLIDESELAHIQTDDRRVGAGFLILSRLYKCIEIAELCIFESYLQNLYDTTSLVDMNASHEFIDSLINELISILTVIREKITDDSDLIRTSYETPLELREEIDRCMCHLQQNHKDILDEINFHFSPTSTFQEHSMANGWTESYGVLAARFDKLYELLNNQ